MKRINPRSGIWKYVGSAFLGLFFALMTFAAAEATLHPFLKKENVKVEPNVLLLIDTSGSMAFKMQNDDKTWGDGTRPYFRTNNSRGIYYGADNNPGLTVSGNNNASIDYNYHPLLRFIPSAELSNAGISTPEANTYFSRRVSGTDPEAKTGESNYKYPNDSRMYALKNVMYRILTDETLVSNIRLALSTYHQNGPLWSSSSSSNYYKWEPYYGDSQGIYWRGGQNEARLVENFNSTTNETHLENIKKWFDGEDDSEHRELRAHGGTPLAVSIYGTKSSDSARTFFNGNDSLGNPVVSEVCQDNWLIVLTDGADTEGGDPVEAVKDLYLLFNEQQKRPIKTFVIGMINPNANKDTRALAKTLSKMADYGENGVLDQDYGDSWDISKSKAYFPQDMEGLLNAFREIFYSIKEQASTGGAPLATPSRSSSGDDSFYQAQYLPRNGKQWEGYLAKFVKNTASDGTITYPEKWEAANRLSKKNWDDRNVYTAFNGLTGSFSNVYPFSHGVDSVNALKGIMGITDSTNAGNFIRWLRGQDVYDENKNGFTNDEQHKLFDIYHSGLVKVGPPAGSSANALYRKFYTEQAERQTIIYVQSNAGMVHGFNDTDGEERFAFIPPNVLGSKRLRGLRWPDGGANYDINFSFPRYLADGPLIAEDVPLGTGDAREYRTVLMGLLGLGGAGMYLVDVTKPDEPAFLWAIENAIYTLGNSKKVTLLGDKDKKVLSWQKNGNTTNSSSYAHNASNYPEAYDYRNLRLTVSTPFIGFLTTGEWAFVMGNGTAGDLNENPAGEVYIGSIEDGRLLKKFQTSTNSPIVSPVAVLYDGISGLIRTFFVGDTSGKVFKGDLSDTENKDNWSLYPVLDVKANVGLSYSLDATRVKNRLWIFVGTGDLEGYLGNQSSTSYFVAADITDVQPGSMLVRNNDLESLSADQASDGLDLNSGKKGWFVTFRDQGAGKPTERMSTAPIVYNGYVFFSTFMPSDDPCSNSGTSRLYALEATTGISGWEDNTKKYIELKDVKISGLSVSSGELVIGMTNYGSGNLGDFRVIGENILLIDAPGGSGGGGESGIMKPLYWKSR